MSDREGDVLLRCMGSIEFEMTTKEASIQGEGLKLAPMDLLIGPYGAATNKS